MRTSEKEPPARKPDLSGVETPREEMASFGYRQVPAREKRQWVKRHFNSIARQYDSMNTILSFGLQHLWKKAAVRALALKLGDRVIDVCAGTGDLSLLAARDVGPEGLIVLYDINQAMMAAAKPKVARSSPPGRIRYIQGDAEHISSQNGQFDAAMVGFGIRNLTTMERGLKEMYRVLRPGGKIMCLEFSMPTSGWFRWLYNVYSFHIMPVAGQILAGTREAYIYLPESIRLFPPPEELAAILERIGFSTVTYQSLTNGIAVIHLGIKPNKIFATENTENTENAK